MTISTHSIEDINVNLVKRLSFNRDTNHRQVKSILNSISNYGLLRLPVCIRTKIITGKKEVFALDGQHLLAALSKGDVKKVKSIVVNTESMEEIVQMMAVLNNISLKWTLLDYVNAYSSLGSYDYNLLHKHSIQNELNITISAEILSGVDSRQSVKNGRFQVKSHDYDKLTTYISDFNRVSMEGISKLQKAYIRFVRSLKSDYDHEKFIDYLKKNKLFSGSFPQDTNYLYNQLHTAYLSITK